MKQSQIYKSQVMVQDDPKLPDDNGEVRIFEWSGWQFDFWCEIFSLLDEGNKLGR
jgi:hypothetical protein